MAWRLARAYNGLGGVGQDNRGAGDRGEESPGSTEQSAR